MKDYSQNGEQKIILEYFKGFIGTFLDIGANDGMTLSNSYALYQKAWEGICVEPSATAFVRLLENQPESMNLNVAIGKENGEVEFYESGEHLGQGDFSLLSTIYKDELVRWKGTNNKFTKKKCECITFQKLLDQTKVANIDFITIDAEGVDYEILTQINLHGLGVKMVIVETNSKEDEKYIRYCHSHGLSLKHKNHENLILAK